MIADRCIYPYLFETPAPPGVPQLRGQQQAPHPFILTPPVPDNPVVRTWRAPAAAGEPGTAPEAISRVALPSARRRQVAAGEELAFELLLMGQAIEYLPYLVYAVSEMARRGLGADRSPFELVTVASIHEGGARTIIYSGESGRIVASAAAARSLSDLIRTRIAELPSAGSLKLRFITPARIRVEGDPQTSMSFELLVRNLLRRVSLLAAVHGREKMDLDYRGLIAGAAGVETASALLEWDDWERYSNRQRAKMKLGGFVGEVEYRGEAIQGYAPLLAAGEILHVGSATSFGLGKYRIVT
jgi:hypothetical protein